MLSDKWHGNFFWKFEVIEIETGPMLFLCMRDDDGPRKGDGRGNDSSTPLVQDTIFPLMDFVYSLASRAGFWSESIWVNCGFYLSENWLKTRTLPGTTLCSVPFFILLIHLFLLFYPKDSLLEVHCPYLTGFAWEAVVALHNYLLDLLIVRHRIVQ